MKTLTKEKIDQVIDDAIEQYHVELAKNPNKKFTVQDENGDEQSFYGHDVIDYAEQTRQKWYKKYNIPTKDEEAFDRARML